MAPKKRKPKSRVEERKERETQAIQARGGACQVCKASEIDDLRFTHRPGIAAEDARWTHSQIWQHTDQDREDELAKCDLLCKTCRSKRKSEPAQTDSVEGDTSRVPKGVVVPPGKDPSVAHHTIQWTWDKDHARGCWRCQELLQQERERNQAEGRGIDENWLFNKMSSYYPMGYFDDDWNEETGQWKEQYR